MSYDEDDYSLEEESEPLQLTLSVTRPPYHLSSKYPSPALNPPVNYQKPDQPQPTTIITTGQCFPIHGHKLKNNNSFLSSTIKKQKLTPADTILRKDHTIEKLAVKLAIEGVLWSCCTCTCIVYCNGLPELHSTTNTRAYNELKQTFSLILGQSNRV